MVKHASSLVLVILIAVAAVGSTTARTISLEFCSFDSALGEPSVTPDLAVGARDYADYGYFLVQTDQPITDAWRESLVSSGATIYGYVSEFAFLVGLDAEGQAAVRSLPGTLWMGPFHPAYKISPYIGLTRFVSPERQQDPKLTLVVRVFRRMEQTAQAIEGLGGEILERSDDGLCLVLVVHIGTEGLNDIARLRDVWWIEEKGEGRLLNNTTRWVIQSNSMGWTPLWDHDLCGSGQIVTILDAGIDYNACWFRDVALAPPGPTHRKVIDLSLFGGTPGEGCENAHGTFVAGIILGDQSFINPGDINYNGMAYKAKLTVQDAGQEVPPCTWPTMIVPGTLTNSLTASYNLGARIHSNSWGLAAGVYNVHCVNVDNFTWQHPDFLTFYAAGNEGPVGGTVRAPGTAKNCVSVGGSQQAPNQENIADFSSRGPTNDGRIKPTLIAPSGQIPILVTSVDGDPSYPPRPTCLTTDMGAAGTSWSTPVAAGAALLVREYYVDGYYPMGDSGGVALAPSAALVKATLIAGTADMSGVTSGVPNMTEGWGRILLDNVLYFPGDTRELLVEDYRTGLSTGQIWSKDFGIDSSSEPLVVSLVWSDYQGTSGSGRKLVNDLNLVVRAPNGTEYKGNVLSEGQSVPGGVADTLNVEEGVRLSAPAPGAWTVEVRAFNVPQSPQPFAVVLNGSLNGPASAPEPAGAMQGRAFVRTYPNPMGKLTSIHYAIPRGYAGPVVLSIVDVQGRTVRTLVNKGQTAGEYRVTWEGLSQSGSALPSGIYFVRLSTGASTASTKLVVRR
jgi:hypothetical protein